MFIKYLRIENIDGLVRKIEFHQGLNLIVDETPSGNEETGNNVGKTTVLRLVDFCLGMDGKFIYTSTEGAKVENKDVKKFLIDTEAQIVLCLTDSFLPTSREVVIRRNFLAGKRSVLEINGQRTKKEEFESKLQDAIWGTTTPKPTFRQIISHNFRLDDQRLSQTLRTLNRYTTDVEYETLHLYMFGCNFDDGERRQELDKKLKTDYTYKRRLEKRASKNALRSTLAIVDHDIETLNRKKDEMNLNPDFEKELFELNQVKMQLNQQAEKQSSLQLRYSLIEEAIDDLNNQKSDIDTNQLRLIYSQASSILGELQHTFEELLAYHNEMLSRKSSFISSELPYLKKEIDICNESIRKLRLREQQLAVKLQQSISYAVLDELVSQLNQKYQEKGSLEQSIKQIDEIDVTIAENEKLLDKIDSGLFSSNKQELVQNQLNKFNRYFSTISQKLYDESYAIEYNLVKNRDGKCCYKFNPFATDNFSTGKKQGEITCFDMAYILFADEEDIPCLHFILNDRKELVHDNQLVRIGILANENQEIQYIASILRDKLPAEINDDSNIVVKLSQHSKLFKIETKKNGI